MMVPVAQSYYWCRRGLLFSCLMMAAVTPRTVAGQEFNLILLHTNDMLSRFNQINQFGGVCSEESDRLGLCFGGFARVKTVVDSMRAKFNGAKSAVAVDESIAAADDGKIAMGTNENVGVLYLDAGNSFRGTALYNNNEGILKVIEQLKPDVMCFGSHDFDKGLKNIKEFIKSTNTPIVGSNIDVSEEPLLNNEKNLKKSTIIEIKGRKIGVIGYLTPKMLSATSKRFGHVKIKPEIEEIEKEVKNLKDQGVNIIIALGNSGFEMDQQIAKQVIGIDIVVGGNSRTFLYTGKAPDIEKPYKSYPWVEAENSSTRRVPVVQAYHSTKYMGKLVVNFDENGEVISANGNPILLNNKIIQDSELLNDIKQMENPDIENIKKKLGSSNVFLQGDDDSCGTGECNLGSFIADAFIDYNIRKNIGKFNLSRQWTDAAVAIIQNDVIVSNISQNSDITMADVLTALPFQNDVGKIQIKGYELKQLIEHGISEYSNVEHSDAFLQVSGLQVVIDFRVPRNHVTKFLVRCADCTVPVYEELKLHHSYNIIVNRYLADGGNGFQFNDLSTKNYESFGITDAEIIMKEIATQSRIMPEISERIVIFNEQSNGMAEEEPVEEDEEDSGLTDYITETTLEIGGAFISTL